MKIEYDKEIEVSLAQYNILKHEYAGVVAHRKEKGKYYIKVLLMKFKEDIGELLALR